MFAVPMPTAQAAKYYFDEGASAESVPSSAAIMADRRRTAQAQASKHMTALTATASCKP